MRFKTKDRSLFCSFRNRYNYIFSFVSKSALVLLLNTHKRFRRGIRSVLCSIRNRMSVFDKIVSNLSNLFEDPDSVRDTGHALVLLLNPTPLEYRSREINSRDTNVRFQGSSRSLLYRFRNQCFVFDKIVSNLSNLFEDPDSVRDTGHALVLLLNPTPLEYRSREINSRDTYVRFQGSARSVLCSFRNQISL